MGYASSTPLDGPLGEEPGWRGYALSQLQADRSPLNGGLILAAVVTLWHVPIVTMIFHIAQGTVSYAALGFAGADADRMDWLTGALWCVIALAVSMLDPRAWRATPPSATADKQMAHTRR